MVLPVTIVGGGIGGLTLAVALKRAQVPFKVLEKAPSIQKIGGGIGLWGPALKALRILGIEEKLHGRMLVCAGYKTSSQTSSDDWLVRPSKTLARHTSCLCLRRAELQHKLLLQLDASDILYGEEVTSFSELSSGVSVPLSDGTSLQASVLIGADGKHSVLRKTLFNITPQPSGYYYWQGISTHPSGEAAYEAWHEGIRFGKVPLTDNDFFWFICSDNDISEGVKESEAVKDQLASQLSMFGASVTTLIASSDPHSIFQAELHELPKMSAWSHGRIALLGDAVHCMAPNLAQGACLAIEDAMELAHQLQQLYKQNDLSSTSVTAAFRKYENTRIPRAHVVQSLVPLVHLVGAAPSPFSHIRNTIFHIIPDVLKTIVFDATHKYTLGWSYTPPNLGQGLYYRLLGDAFMSHHPSLAAFHRGDHDRHCSGSAIITGSTSIFARILRYIMCMPSETPQQCTVDLSITTDTTLGKEKWNRVFCFDDGCLWKFNTTQHIYQEELLEDFGYMRFIMKNSVETASFTSTLTEMCVKCGSILIPVPSIFQPIVVGKTIPSPDGWKFEVSIRAPRWAENIVGLIIRYEGNINKYSVC